MEQSLLSPELADVAHRGCHDELTDYTVYLALSRREKNPKFRDALIGLGDTERGHYEFWKKYAPNAQVRAIRLRVYFVQLLRLLLGLTFTLKFLERHESVVVRRYRQVEHYIPPEDKARFDQMVADEEH